MSYYIMSTSAHCCNFNFTLHILDLELLSCQKHQVCLMCSLDLFLTHYASCSTTTISSLPIDGMMYVHTYIIMYVHIMHILF